MWWGLRKQLKWLASAFIFSNAHNEGNVLGELNRLLIERGFSPPWIYSKAKCIEYWKKKANKAKGNRPCDYLNKETAINDFLNSIMVGCKIPRSSEILEVGCNVATNLNEMRKHGYKRVYGIEINRAVVPVIAKEYPCIDLNKIRIGDAKDELARHSANSFDFVFSMAVLMHMHPSDGSIFKDIARVSRKYICTIEPEHASCAYVFPRNYKRVFERLGYKELYSTVIPETISVYNGYTIRLFIKHEGIK